MQKKKQNSDAIAKTAKTDAETTKTANSTAESETDAEEEDLCRYVRRDIFFGLLSV